MKNFNNYGQREINSHRKFSFKWHGPFLVGHVSLDPCLFLGEAGVDFMFDRYELGELYLQVQVDGNGDFCYSNAIYFLELFVIDRRKAQFTAIPTTQYDIIFL